MMKTEIQVSAVYDGELDATDVFVELIAQKYGGKGNFIGDFVVNGQDTGYNNGKACQGLVPSGLCG